MTICHLLLPEALLELPRHLKNGAGVQGSVLRTMWRAHARVFIMIGGIKLFDNILTFASPLLLERLLLNLQEGKPAGTAVLLVACI